MPVPITITKIPFFAAADIPGFVLKGFVSLLIGPLGEERSSLARTIAADWIEAGIPTLYLQAGAESRFSFSDIAMQCAMYERKCGSPLGGLVIDCWEEAASERYFNSHFLDMRLAFLKLKVFAFERQMRVLLVGLDRSKPGDPPRPRPFLPFMAYEAKTVMAMGKDAAGKPQATVWQGQMRRWEKGLTVCLSLAQG
ncbi:MAG TPA: hypothetical protein PLV42_05515 [bacterium]|nr:hypothetical protein [bacterium]